MSFRLERLSDLFRVGTPRHGGHAEKDGAVEYGVSSPDQALALCADALGRASRVEVRIDKALAAKTNPAQFRERANRQARAFVRDGRTAYSLSVAWSDFDLSTSESRIRVRVFPRVDDAHRSATSPAAKLSQKDVNALKEEIVREIHYAVRQQGGAAAGDLAGLTLLCRDAEFDPWLRSWKTNHEAAWHDAFARQVQKAGASVRPSFRADYKFEERAPKTDEVGAGRLIVLLHRADEPMPSDKPPAENGARDIPLQEPYAPAQPEGTVELGDEGIVDDRVSVTVTLTGFGQEAVEGGTPVPVPLPGKIDRDTVRKSLPPTMDERSLLVVSKKAPLVVDFKKGCLFLTGQRRRGANGARRPTHFLVVDGKEVPLENSQWIPSDRAEVLLGGESHHAGRHRDGRVIRPVRILVALSKAPAIP
jgi:hypothetical protein